MGFLFLPTVWKVYLWFACESWPRFFRKLWKCVAPHKRTTERFTNQFCSLSAPPAQSAPSRLRSKRTHRSETSCWGDGGAKPLLSTQTSGQHGGNVSVSDNARLTQTVLHLFLSKKERLLRVLLLRMQNTCNIELDTNKKRKKKCQ